MCVCIYTHYIFIVNNAALNTDVNVSFRSNVFIFFKYIPRGEIAGPYGISGVLCCCCLFVCFLRNLLTVFHSGSTNLHSHQQCTSVPISPHPCQHLLSVFFLMIVVLTDVK